MKRTWRTLPAFVIAFGLLVLGAAPVAAGTDASTFTLSLAVVNSCANTTATINASLAPLTGTTAPLLASVVGGTATITQIPAGDYLATATVSYVSASGVVSTATVSTPISIPLAINFTIPVYPPDPCVVVLVTS